MLALLLLLLLCTVLSLKDARASVNTTNNFF